MRALHLGIVYAMPMEGKGLASPPPRHHEPVRVRQNCTLVCAGMGGANARLAATALCEAGVDALVSWGCAAGLAPSLDAGAIVVPGEIVNADGERMAVDGALHRLLLDRLGSRLGEPITIHTGSAMTSEQPIATRHQKAALHQRFDVATVDMESVAIALVAQSRGLPFVALRVVLDTADQCLPPAVLDGMGDDGSFSVARAGTCLLRHPAQLLQMARLILNSWRARSSLQRAARCVATPSVGL